LESDRLVLTAVLDSALVIEEYTFVAPFLAGDASFHHQHKQWRISPFRILSLERSYIIRSQLFVSNVIVLGGSGKRILAKCNGAEKERDKQWEEQEVNNVICGTRTWYFQIAWPGTLWSSESFSYTIVPAKNKSGNVPQR